MNTLWLLSGLGLGAGLMYLGDPQQGEERRDVLRRNMAEYGHQTEDLFNSTTQTLGRQAQAVMETARGPFRRRQAGLGERFLTQAGQLGTTTGLVLLGCVGLGAGLFYLLEPQEGARRRSRLREKARDYWHHTPRSASEEKLVQSWRVFQGHETRRVDAHTRKPALAQSWYAEPRHYDSPLLYSEPFATREDAEAWVLAQNE